MSTAIISYPFNVGGQLKDRWMWMATIDGEVYDYQNKKTLKKSLEADGHSWEVHRRNKDGTTSVIERSNDI